MKTKVIISIVAALVIAGGISAHATTSAVSNKALTANKIKTLQIENLDNKNIKVNNNSSNSNVKAADITKLSKQVREDEGTKSINNNIEEVNNVNGKIGYVTNIAVNSEPEFIVPTDNGNSRYVINNGVKVTILGEKGDYYKVKQNGEFYGYINKKYVTFTDNQDDIHPNDNAIISKYFGNWVVGKQIGSTVGEVGKYNSYEGQKLIMTDKLYSFMGKVIKNPQYYIYNMSVNSYFGDSKYNKLQNVTGNKFGELQVLVVLPQNEKITNRVFNDKFPADRVLIAGNKVITYGGGLGNSSINECVREN